MNTKPRLQPAWLGAESADRLSIRVLSYEFDGETDGEDDANWLVIEGQCRRGNHAVCFQHPCLLTSELAELIAWLERSIDQSQPPIEFIEPLLAFEQSAGASSEILVTLRGEALPEGMVDHEVRWGDGVRLSINASPDEIRDVCERLAADLAKFPPRSAPSRPHPASSHTRRYPHTIMTTRLRQLRLNLSTFDIAMLALPAAWLIYIAWYSRGTDAGLVIIPAVVAGLVIPFILSAHLVRRAPRFITISRWLFYAVIAFILLRLTGVIPQGPTPFALAAIVAAPLAIGIQLAIFSHPACFTGRALDRLDAEDPLEADTPADEPAEQPQTHG